MGPRKPSSVLPYVVVTVWLVVGGYVGVSGWMGMKALQNASVRPDAAASRQSLYELDGLSFRDEQSVREFLQEEQFARLAPWVFELPADVIPLIASLAFGMLGGAARLLKDLKSSKAQLPARLLFAEPILGAVIGLMAFVLAWALPSLVVTETGPLRPQSVVAFALCGGAFSDRAWIWLESISRKLFDET